MDIMEYLAKIGLPIGQLAGFAIMLLAMRLLYVKVKSDLNRRIDGVENNLTQRINDVEHNLNRRIDGVENNLTQRINDVEHNLNRRIDGVENNLTQRINDVEHNLNRRIDGVENNLTRQIDYVAGSVSEIAFLLSDGENAPLTSTQAKHVQEMLHAEAA
ncbi:MAG: hypothetical protein LBR38_00635 [Synergistaceae bacterium]|jgi:uncharacterized membrane-anchored protein YhcB (DUF1043 family)|nr:hypothetical protein [Synergistaceae bacterium]